MLEAWRIVKRRHVATAFSGEGAARTGGRWNSRGVPAVYTSSARSLATLETLVHLNPPLAFKYAMFRLEFDPSLLESLPLTATARGLAHRADAAVYQTIGDDWVRTARTAVLALPSAIIPGEINYLLNPNHPDFKRIVIRKPETLVFDPRRLA